MNQNVAAGGVGFSSIGVAAPSPIVLPGADEGVYYDAVGNLYQWGAPAFGGSQVTVPRFIEFDDGAGGDTTMSLQAAGGSLWKFGHQGALDIMQLQMLQGSTITVYDWGDSDYEINTQSGVFSEVWRINGQIADTTLFSHSSTSGLLIANDYPGIGGGGEGNLTLRYHLNAGADDGVLFTNQNGAIGNFFVANFDSSTNWEIIGANFFSKSVLAFTYTGFPGHVFEIQRSASGAFEMWDVANSVDFISYDPGSLIIGFGLSSPLVQAYFNCPIITEQGSLSAPGLWRFGDVVIAASVLDATQYVEVEINGAIYKLALIV